jgi:1-acyl-sn-glycerol-3-phosphate acyltransferase
VPSTLVVTAIAVALLPVTLTVGAIVDAAIGPRWRWRRCRVVLLVTGLLVIEAVGTIRAGTQWIRSGFGTRVAGTPSQERHHALERWWTGCHRALLRRVAGMRLEIEGEELLVSGPLIAVGRHTSHADAALPAWVLARDHGFRLRYVLKDDLQWSPCMDIVGNRLPNHFVDRDPQDPAAELAAVRDLVADMAPNEAAVIFPEGTFPTEQRRRRAVERIRAQDPDRAARVEDLAVLLPPRPGGTLAILEGAPDADVLLIAHVGFERLSSVGEIVRGLPFTEPCTVKLWRIPRREVPLDPDGRRRWLDDVWHDLDAWVADHLLPSAPSPASASAGTEPLGGRT